VSVQPPDGLTLASAAAILRSAMRDHTYRGTAIGADVVAFLAYKRLSRRSERTLDSYERALAPFAVRHADRTLAEITSEDLLEELARYRHPTRPRIMSHFTEFFRWALVWDRITRDPTLKLPEIRRDPPPLPRLFTEAEQARLCALPEVRDRALMLLLFGSGIRDGEARRLVLADVDLEERTLQVFGKGRRERLVPLPRRTVNALAELTLLDGLRDGDYLWYRRATNQHSSRVMREREIVYSGFHGWWKRCLAEAAVRYRNPHTTRHTYATLYLRAGGRMERLSRILGHAHVGITESHYAHLDVTDLAEDAELVMIARGWDDAG
jgi:integrase/recombinase XerD